MTQEYRFMLLYKFRQYPLISLIFTAIICGLIWRIEVEYHGWKGLTWISYFHFAIPIGFGLFLLWSNFFVQTNILKRITFNFIAILFGVLVYYLLTRTLVYRFNNGPSAFISKLFTPEWKVILYQFQNLVLVLLIPAGAYLILRIFRQKPLLRSLVIAMIGIMISIPLSILILWIVNHKGEFDFIHAIKSGVLIPLWFVSVGFLFVGLKKEDRISSNIQSESFHQ